MKKVGIIGTGLIGQTHAKCLQHIQNAKLQAIVQPMDELRNRQQEEFNCKGYANVKDMLEDKEIDIVDICVPTYLHCEMVKLAASYGKHIICEKPFALTLDEVDQMIQAVNKAGIKLLVAQVVRFWPEYAKIKEIVQKGLLGTGQRILTGCRLSQYPNWSGWFKDTSKSGGALFDLHIHDVDFAYYLFGEVESVYATGFKNSTGAWDHVISTLNFKSGDKAVIEGCNLMPDGYPFTMRMKVSGIEATVDLNYIGGYNVEGRDIAEKSLYYYKDKNKRQCIEGDDSDPYKLELEYFINTIENNDEINILPLTEVRKVIELMIAINKSLETNEIQYL